jgi:hypothetical protein
MLSGLFGVAPEDVNLRSQWRLQPQAPDLGNPVVTTLANSYLALDRWVFEVEILLTQGMARLRVNRADLDAAVLVTEALRRLKVARAERLRAKAARRSTVERLLRGRSQKEKRTRKERHHDDLEQLAMGILVAYGAIDYWEAITVSVQDGIDSIAAVLPMTSINVGLLDSSWVNAAD